ncbi:MAG: hypothetical protein SPI30_03965 [Prevotella sp.]|nr:hypothetical protein [Prevotella sp.]
MTRQYYPKSVINNRTDFTRMLSMWAAVFGQKHSRLHRGVTAKKTPTKQTKAAKERYY